MFRDKLLAAIAASEGINLRGLLDLFPEHRHNLHNVIAELKTEGLIEGRRAYRVPKGAIRDDLAPRPYLPPSTFIAPIPLSRLMGGR